MGAEHGTDIASMIGVTREGVRKMEIMEVMEIMERSKQWKAWRTGGVE